MLNNHVACSSIPPIPEIPADDIQARFEQFHSANPHVYRSLVELARQAKRAGKTRYGIKALVEILRWNHEVVTNSNDGFLINNVFTARYARLIEQQEPDLAGFFVTRALTANKN